MKNGAVMNQKVGHRSVVVVVVYENSECVTD